MKSRGPDGHYFNSIKLIFNYFDVLYYKMEQVENNKMVAETYAKKMVDYLGENYFNKFIFDLIKQDLQIKYTEILINKIGTNKTEFFEKNVLDKFPQHNNLSLNDLYDAMDWADEWDGDFMFTQLIKINKCENNTVEDNLSDILNEYINQICNNI